jgi:hypothetical protein
MYQPRQNRPRKAHKQNAFQHLLAPWNHRSSCFGTVACHPLKHIALSMVGHHASQRNLEIVSDILAENAIHESSANFLFCLLVQYTYGLCFILFAHVLAGRSESPVLESSVTRIPKNIHGESRLDSTEGDTCFRSNRAGMMTSTRAGQANMSIWKRPTQIVPRRIRRFTLCSPRCGKRKTIANSSGESEWVLEFNSSTPHRRYTLHFLL